jgi:NADH-quinone oxidoreductase subunit J
MEAFFFLLLAAVSVFSALMVILQKNPVASVLFLVLTFFSLASLYIMLSAPFLAIIQIIIYVGAVMVLFLFVLMLLNLKRLQEGGLPAMKITGVLVAGLLMVVVTALLRAVAMPSGSMTKAAEGLGTVENVGARLFTHYLLPLEIASFLLLAAIIGAIVLAKSREVGSHLNDPTE